MHTTGHIGPNTIIHDQQVAMVVRALGPLANQRDLEGCGNQVTGCQAFDQFGCVIASMREPGKQGPCRLFGRHAVGFFKEYFADALVVHGNLGKGCRK